MKKQNAALHSMITSIFHQLIPENTGQCCHSFSSGKHTAPQTQTDQTFLL